MRYRLACMIGFLLLQLLPASGQDFVVLDRGSKHYRPGHTFSAGERVEIPAGSSMTLLASSGALIRLAGPYSGQLSLPRNSPAETRRALNLLAAMLKGAARKSASLAATRSVKLVGKTSRIGNLWNIDADRSGPQCVQAGPVELLRADGSASLSVTILPLVDSPLSTEWPAGEHSLLLADNGTITSGTQLRIVGGKREIIIILWQLPKEIDANASGKVLLWLSANGCEAQALQLAAQTASSGGAQK